MAKIYWRTIKRGTRTLSQVPEKLQAAVKALADGELEAGTITQEEYDALTGAVKTTTD